MKQVMIRVVMTTDYNDDCDDYNDDCDDGDDYRLQ